MRRIENGLGRTIVLIEDDDPSVREVLLEIEDVADVCAAPGVDRLVRGTLNTEVAVARGAMFGQDIVEVLDLLEVLDVHAQRAAAILPQVVFMHGQPLEHY